MRTARLERLLKLIQALERGHPKAVDELAEWVGVSRRTIFRDLELLARAGIRYDYKHQVRRYTTERTTLLPPVTLTPAEAMALLLISRYLRVQKVLPDPAAAVSAGLKLESALPPAIRDYYRPLLERMDIRGDPASDPSAIQETLSILQTAMMDQRKIQAKYDSYSEERVLDVILHPYRLIYIHRGWYLIAFTESASRVQTYKVERILRLRMLPEAYAVDPGFTIEGYLGNAWLMIRENRNYHVKVRFLKQVAANVDEIHWHRTQHTTYEEDGSLIFEADVDGIREISWWILGYGDQAQVLEPPELRALVARRVKNMYDYYHSPADKRVAGDAG